MENFNEMKLPELVQYREALNGIAKQFAKTLSTYATMNGDMEFKRMTPKMQLVANKRIKIINIMDKLDAIIEEKALTLFD